LAIVVGNSCAIEKELIMASGYDKSPDYGDPPQAWKIDLFLILLVATIIGAFFVVFWPF
jgi:hypothetical protein